MKIQCDSCQAKFTGPDRLAGRRVSCPNCGQVIAVPAAQAAAMPKDGAAAGDVAPLSNLLDDAFPSEPALPPESAAAEALGIVRKRRPSGPSFPRRLASLAGNDVENNALVRFLSEHKLVVTVFAVAGFWILFDVCKLETGVIALFACFGILFGAGAWKIQSVAQTKAGESWQWLELGLGRFLLGIPIVVIGAGCCRV